MNLAYRIREAAQLRGEFTLRSGETSDVYFDKYRFESDPALLRAIGVRLAALVPFKVDLLGGLELGGIPLVTMVSQRTGIPAVFVRKEAKAHGTCNHAEGAEVAGKHLLVVEDVVTSGGAILDAVERLRADGAEVDRAICVVDREAGGKELLAEAGIDLAALFTRSQLEAATAE